MTCLIARESVATVMVVALGEGQLAGLEMQERFYEIGSPRGFEDLETESSGEGLRRFVVVYPRGAERVSAPRPMRNAHQRR